MPGSNGSRRNRPDSAYGVTVATDTPFFPADLVARFLAALGDARQRLLVARSDEGVHPVFGLWPVALAADIEACAEAWHAQGRAASPSSMAPSRCSSRRSRSAAAKIDPFFNINRPEDLAEAEALLREHAP